MIVLQVNLQTITVIRIPPLETMNMFGKFHSNPLNSSDISVYINAGHCCNSPMPAYSNYAYPEQ